MVGAPLVVPGLDGFNEVMAYVPGFVWFIGKTFFVVALLLWIRWTSLRLRVDQILRLEWEVFDAYVNGASRVDGSTR